MDGSELLDTDHVLVQEKETKVHDVIISDKNNDTTDEASLIGEDELSFLVNRVYTSGDLVASSLRMLQQGWSFLLIMLFISTYVYRTIVYRTIIYIYTLCILKTIFGNFDITQYRV